MGKTRCKNLLRKPWFHGWALVRKHCDQCCTSVRIPCTLKAETEIADNVLFSQIFSLWNSTKKLVIDAEPSFAHKFTKRQEKKMILSKRTKWDIFWKNLSFKTAIETACSRKLFILDAFEHAFCHNTLERYNFHRILPTRVDYAWFCVKYMNYDHFSGLLNAYVFGP